MQDYLPEKLDIKVVNESAAALWPTLFKSHYCIENDHFRLLALSDLSQQQQAPAFDLLRKNYPTRYEYNQYRISGISDKKIASQVERLLFTIA